MEEHMEVVELVRKCEKELFFSKSNNKTIKSCEYYYLGKKYTFNKKNNYITASIERWPKKNYINYDYKTKKLNEFKKQLQFIHPKLH